MEKIGFIIFKKKFSRWNENGKVEKKNGSVEETWNYKPNAKKTQTNPYPYAYS